MTTDRKPTQLERVAMMLFEQDEVCGTEWLAAWIPRYSAHLHRLRKAGWHISRRPCNRHYHESVQWLYCLESLPFNPAGKGEGDA